MPKCKICKNSFKPKFSSLEPTCGEIDCRTKWAMQVVAKQKLAKDKKAKQQYIKERKEGYDKLKTLSQYEAEAKKSFQLWVRMRDKDLPCISCGIKETELFDGGHFFKAEIFSGLIFDERNVHKQCRKCNRFQGGNELQYRKGLVNRFGLEFVEKLEYESDSKRNYKFTKNELIAKKLQYDIKIKELKK